MAEKRQLEGVSPEALQAGMPFINASRKEVPPFGCMEVVGDPKLWVSSASLESSNDAYFGWNRGGAMVTATLDNRQMLFCAEPGRGAEMLQIPSQFVFNGSSPVQPGKGGKCFACAPVRALTATYGIDPNEFLSQGIAPGLRVKAGSFALYPTNSQFRGAFSWRGNSGQVIKYEGQTSAGVTGQVSYVEPNYSQVYSPYSMYGLWYVKGKGKTPLGYGDKTLATSQAIWDFSGDSVLLRGRGTYRFLFRAILKPGNPSRTTIRVPYRIGIIPWTSADNDRYKRSGYVNLEPEVNYIWRWARRWLPNYVVGGPNSYDTSWVRLASDYAFPARDELLWEYHVFSYFEQIEVTRPPVRIGILQDQNSPVTTDQGLSKMVGEAGDWNVWPGVWESEFDPWGLESGGGRLIDRYVSSKTGQVNAPGYQPAIENPNTNALPQNVYPFFSEKEKSVVL